MVDFLAYASMAGPAQTVLLTLTIVPILLASMVPLVLIVLVLSIVIALPGRLVQFVLIVICSLMSILYFNELLFSFRIGLLCHLDDACTSNPCHKDALCDTSPINGSYTCSCASGYKGVDCSEDINECEQGMCCICKIF